MSRILRRPMFKMGGSTNSGIMTGLVDRKGYAEDTGIKSRVVAKSARDYISEFNPLLQEFTPKTQLPLGAVGAALVSGTPIKDALISGYQDFTTRDDARTAGIQKGAVQLGLSQALKDAAPSKQSVLAAEKKARYLLPPDATADQIRAKTAEIIRNEMTGSTYSPQANLQRAIASYRAQYGEGSKAFNHAAFDVKVAPELRAAGKNPRSSIKFKDGKYKTKNKSPGVYIDVENGKVIEFDGNIAKELPEYSAMLR